MESGALDEKPCDGVRCHRTALAGGERGQCATNQRLCRACLSRLVGEIRELPRLYEQCGMELGGGAAGGLREKTTGGPVPGQVFNGSAAEARTAVLTVLGSWSGLVAQQRRLPEPVREVSLLADFLLANLSWLASHPAAGNVTEEIAQAVATARRAAFPDPVKRIAVGPCVVPGCAGELAATVRASQAGAGTQVRCGVDPAHAWDQHEWTCLRQAMRRQAPAAEQRWIVAADIARLWSTPTGTVYRLASEHRWRRISRAGRTYYAESDVHRSFSRRKARALPEG